MRSWKKTLLTFLRTFSVHYEHAFICCECGRIEKEAWRYRVEIGKEMCYECYVKRARDAKCEEFHGVDQVDGLPGNGADNRK
jgi:hypothetical protein